MAVPGLKLWQARSSSLTWIEPGSTALGAQSLSYWTIREVPYKLLKILYIL